jgi:hypothetical protein
MIPIPLSFGLVTVRPVLQRHDTGTAFRQRSGCKFRGQKFRELFPSCVELVPTGNHALTLCGQPRRTESGPRNDRPVMVKKIR